MWGPCEDHVLAIKGPYFSHFYEKIAIGYTQQCEIWHGTSLGTLIKIQEPSILRTMWGPCFGHKGVMFWAFLGKVATGYTQHCEIWHGTSLGTLIKIQEEQIEEPGENNVLAIKGHILSISRIQQCEILHGASLGTLIKNQEEPILKTMWGHLLAIKGHILAIFRNGG